MKEKFNSKLQKPKPFVARTKDGDYFFNTEEEARSFAHARGGFFDTQENISRSNKAKNLAKRRYRIYEWTAK